MRILARLDRGIRPIPKKFRFTIRTVDLHRTRKFKRYHWALTICRPQSSKKVAANIPPKTPFRGSVPQEVNSVFIPQEKKKKKTKKKERHPNPVA